MIIFFKFIIIRMSTKKTIPILYKTLNNEKFHKFFCNCDINSCYCLNFQKINFEKINFEKINFQKNKKITKNQSNKNYNYLLGQWTNR